MTYVTNVIFHEFEHLYDCIVRIMDLEIKYKVIKYILFYFKLNTFLPNALKKKKKTHLYTTYKVAERFRVRIFDLCVKNEQ